MATMFPSLTLIVQGMGAFDTHLPPWPAHETSISRLLCVGEERGSTNFSLDSTAPEDYLSVRSAIR